MMTSAPLGASSPLSMSWSVLPSPTFPGNIFERRTKPLLSSTMPRVTSGQSVRFSFERPRAALGLSAAAPSKHALGLDLALCHRVLQPLPSCLVSPPCLVPPLAVLPGLTLGLSACLLLLL